MAPSHRVLVHFNVYYKKIGILLGAPAPGETGTRLMPPLVPAEVSDLYGVFLTDFVARLSKLKKMSATVFYAGNNPGKARDSIPGGCRFVPQEEKSPGERLESAFRVLLEGDGGHACVLGSESPDVPLIYVKRAFVKLKHKDVVLGPTFGGGCYLIGLRRPVTRLFDALPWGEATLFGETLCRVGSAGLSCAVLPPWYEVNTLESLSFLETMLLARKIEKRDRLPTVERVLDEIRRRSR